MNERAKLGSEQGGLNVHFWVFTAVERMIATWAILAAQRVDRVSETDRLGGGLLSRYSVFIQ